MAEASMEDRPTTNRFFCHKCNIHFQNATSNFTCPHCSHGFIEELDVGSLDGIGADSRVDLVDDLTSSDDEMLHMMNLNELGRLFTSGLSRQSGAHHRPHRAPPSRRNNASSSSSGAPSNRRRRYAEFRLSASRNNRPHFTRWPANSRNQSNGGAGQPAHPGSDGGPSPFEHLIQDFIVNLGGFGWTADFTTGGGGGGGGGGAHRHNQNAMHLLLPGNPGDYAWGREGLDAIVTQLLNQMDSSGPPPLQSDAIQALPFVPVAEEHVAAKLQCSVCWEDFKLDELVKMLPCQHMYHESCIVPWLALHGTCPICRKVLQVGATREDGTTEIQQPSNSESYDTNSANGNSPFNTLQQLFQAVRHGTSSSNDVSSTSTNLPNSQQNEDSND